MRVSISNKLVHRRWAGDGVGSLRHVALALVSFGHFAQAAGTSRATDAAPRASEIEWIDLSDYDAAQAMSTGNGQPITIDLLNGRKLRFRLKYTNGEPEAATYGVAASPISFDPASFGRTGYLGIAGQPII